MSASDAVVHVYLSTGCLHGRHDYCNAPTGQAGGKRPAECKWCGAPCVCPCHTAAPVADAAGQSSITCPRCGATSYNPNDVRYGYCGRCHAYTGEKVCDVEGHQGCTVFECRWGAPLLLAGDRAAAGCEAYEDEHGPCDRDA